MNAASLRDARAELGLTQHGLAKALKMGRWGWQTISGWETGAKPIPGPIEVAIDRLLDLARRAKEQDDGR